MSHARSSRRGAVLVLALVVIVVATAVGQTAMVAALHAIRRVEYQQAALRETLARDALWARIDERLGQVALASLLGRSIVLNADTTWRLEAAAAGWYRIDALVGARVILSSLSTAPPWRGPCSAALIGGVLAGDSAALLPDASVGCPSLSRITAASYDSIDALWRQQVVAGDQAEDIVMDASTPETDALFGGAGVIRIRTGARLRGIVWGQVVILEPGATVEGLILARDSLVLGAGALLRGSGLSAVRAWDLAVRARPLGRRGALSFP
jgi:hypothetical protein